eukprot:894183_1
MGKRYDAILDAEKALLLQTSLFGPEDSETCQTMCFLGRLHQERGDLIQALVCFHGVVDIQRQNHNGSLLHPDVAFAIYNVGCLYHQMRRYEDAAKAYTRGLKIYETIGFPRDHPDVIR